MQGVDYSFSRPDINCLWDKGYRFVIRYTSNGSSGKNASKAEIDALIRKGFKVGIVHQNGTSDMLEGYSKGVMDATSAKKKTEALGMPPDRPIFFPLDRDPEPLSNEQWTACKRYLDGCASVLGRNRVGVYGGYRAIEILCPTSAPWGWQTYAWSRGRISSKAHFRQYKNAVKLCGGEVDLNETYKPDFGQWPIDKEGMPELDATERKLLRDAEARTQWIMQFMRDGALDAMIEAKVKEALREDSSTPRSVFRQKMRELARLGAEDALRDSK